MDQTPRRMSIRRHPRLASHLGIYSGKNWALYVENADWDFIDLPDEPKDNMTSRQGLAISAPRRWFLSLASDKQNAMAATTRGLATPRHFDRITR